MSNYQPINPSAKKLWMIHGTILTAILLAISIFIFIVIYHQIWIFLIVAGIGILSVFVFPIIEYKQWRFAITQECVDIIHGLFWVTRSVIPVNRVQHISISQGVIQKKFNLTNVDIYTASGKHTIEGILREQAEEIAAHLNRIVLVEAQHGEF